MTIYDSPQRERSQVDGNVDDSSPSAPAITASVLKSHPQCLGSVHFRNKLVTEPKSKLLFQSWPGQILATFFPPFFRHDHWETTFSTLRAKTNLKLVLFAKVDLGISLQWATWCLCRGADEIRKQILRRLAPNCQTDWARDIPLTLTLTSRL